MKYANELDEDILDYIENGIDAPKDEDTFNQLALDIFDYQYRNNKPYSQYCNSLNKPPGFLSSWKEIPAVPTSVFKEVDLASFPIHRAEKVFHTSGTTQQKSGKHYMETCLLYNASLVSNFRAHVIPDIALIPMLSLTQSPEEDPHSSLVHMIQLVMQLYGTTKSKFFIQNGELLINEFIDNLREYESFVTPVLILGTSFSFIHFLDYCNEHNLHFKLPKESRIMETGGFKGKSREIQKKHLYEMFQSTLGIQKEYIINEYGMTEMGTQFYDNTLINFLNKKSNTTIKIIPPWSRVRVIDPETSQEVPSGQTGILQYIDLTNRGSVISIQTEDIGYLKNDGFEIIGRATNSEPRGCSLGIDEILSK